MPAAALRQPSFEAIRDIAANCQAVRFRYGSSRKSILVDAYTASAVVSVHDAVALDNQAKMQRMIAGTPDQFRRVVEFCLKRYA